MFPMYSLCRACHSLASRPEGTSVMERRSSSCTFRSRHGSCSRGQFRCCFPLLVVQSSSMDVNVTIKACDKCWHSHADRYDYDPNTDVMIYLYFVQHW